MTLKDRYDTQRKKCDRLSERLASLEMKEKLREAGVSEELNELRSLITEFTELQEVFKSNIAELEKCKTKYEALVLSLEMLWGDMSETINDCIKNGGAE